MNETKPWYLSKTAWASLATVLVSLLGLLKFTVGVDFAEGFADWAVTAATVVTGAMALYGRLTARRRMGTGSNPCGGHGGGVVPLAGAALLLACLSGVCGCATPEAAFVRAERATYQAVAPEYVAYVEADPALSDEEKERRRRTVRTWDLSIRQHEAAAQAHTRPGVNP